MEVPAEGLILSEGMQISLLSKRGWWATFNSRAFCLLIGGPGPGLGVLLHVGNSYARQSSHPSAPTRHSHAARGSTAACYRGLLLRVHLLACDSTFPLVTCREKQIRFPARAGVRCTNNRITNKIAWGLGRNSASAIPAGAREKRNEKKSVPRVV